MQTVAFAFVFAGASQAIQLRARGDNDVHECQAGQYWESKAIGCTECKIGHFCPVGTGKDPEACHAGTYQDMAGAKSAADCKLCHIGFYADHEGAVRCEPCPAGTFCAFEGMAQAVVCPVNKYCPQGTTEPMKCPEKSHNDATGNGSKDSCRVDEPVICPAGSHAMGPSECVDCPAGEFCEVMGLKEPSGRCPINFYCPAGSVTPTACPAGFITKKTGCTEKMQCVEDLSCAPGMAKMGGEECKICPAGFFCNTGLEDPEWCPPGYYCPAGSVVPLECPAGTTDETYGSKDATECLSLDQLSEEQIAEQMEIVDAVEQEEADAEAEKEADVKDKKDDLKDDLVPEISLVQPALVAPPNH